MATTCNKNEQQQDAKNNAEMQAEWTKTTWKTFEETVRLCRNRSVEAWIETDNDDDDDGILFDEDVEADDTKTSNWLRHASYETSCFSLHWAY